jgi:hypothetical protein
VLSVKGIFLMLSMVMHLNFFAVSMCSSLDLILKMDLMHHVNFSLHQFWSFAKKPGFKECMNHDCLIRLVIIIDVQLI